MIRVDGFEMPAAREQIHRRAVRLEWVTIVYMASAVFVIYLVLRWLGVV